MTDIIIITPDTNKKEIGCNFKNCSRISFCIMQRSRPQKFSFGSASFFIPTDNDYTKETIALTKIIKTINAIHDMTSPATAKLRGVLKIPTNEKIKPKAYNTQPSPGTQLKIKPNKARIKPAVPSPFVLLRSC